MAAEPARPEPVLRNRRGHSSERPAYRQKKKKLNLQPSNQALESKLLQVGSVCEELGDSVRALNREI